MHAGRAEGAAGAVRRTAQHGARISEFPVTREAADAAAAQGLGTVMGAPNAWRGGSHLSGLSAREALTAGVLHALVSDYHTGSLLAAVDAPAAAGTCPLATAVRLVTGVPRRSPAWTTAGCSPRAGKPTSSP